MGISMGSLGGGSFITYYWVLGLDCLLYFFRWFAIFICRILFNFGSFVSFFKYLQDIKVDLFLIVLIGHSWLTSFDFLFRVQSWTFHILPDQIFNLELSQILNRPIIPKFQPNIIHWCYDKISDQILDIVTNSQSDTYFLFVHLNIVKTCRGVWTGLHFNERLGVFGIDFEFGDVLKAIKGDGALFDAELDIGVDDFFGGVGAKFLVGSVEAVLEGEIGLIPDNSLLVAHLSTK